MKPVIVFRNVEHEGPGYLGDFLTQHNIPWQIINTSELSSIPASILGYSGVVIMGGPMSVNDDLPWIAPLLNLIREAKAADIPLLGHCLGGQLISKALGGVISANPIKEIGWGEVSVTPNEVAKHWFGDIESFNSFHWHGETFSLPEGATHLLASTHCQNQAYSIGKHLAFQSHIEVTTEMVKSWCEIGADELTEAAASPAVQQAEAMQQNLPVHCFFLNKVAKQVYGQWIKGLMH
ncbi:MAG: type 1 glutamine amidotransferase [Methylotenera sp.]|uniref:type 1 glutamine amidotransferase n=1 Tax=Methylotenera sp. TaxID=2051956 RepID=UPI002489036F|nr:type 1 glutamine amidotransferase [Methylotenera sp.]MDI1310310.1 type 1 glutamine amidotransferase [Methylotenera sp.]